jgi:hypothetical protein
MSRLLLMRRGLLGRRNIRRTNQQILRSFVGLFPLPPSNNQRFFVLCFVCFSVCGTHLRRRIFHTTFIGTENSSAETRGRAKELAQAIGSYHIDMNMDTLVASVQSLFTLVTGKTPSFKVHGGSDAENLALQNIQVSSSLFIYSLFLLSGQGSDNTPGPSSNGPLVLVCTIVALGPRTIRWSPRPRFLKRRRSTPWILYQIRLQLLRYRPHRYLTPPRYKERLIKRRHFQDRFKDVFRTRPTSL